LFFYYGITIMNNNIKIFLKLGNKILAYSIIGLKLIGLAKLYTR